MSTDFIQNNPGMTYIKPLPDASGNNGGVAFGRIATLAPGSTAAPSGGAYCAISPVAQTIAGSGTINHNNCGAANVNAAGAVTGIIIQAGTVQGQTLDIFVTSAAANTLTMAAAATSNVADGTSTVLAGLRAYRFIWDVASARWYRAG